MAIRRVARAGRRRRTPQVLDEGIPVEGAAVRFEGPRQVHEATDEEGEFRVGDLPKGSYDLAIGTADRVVDVSPLDLG